MDTNTEQLSIIANGWIHKDAPTFEELSASILQTKGAMPSHQLWNSEMGQISATPSDKLVNLSVTIHPTPSDEFITPLKTLVEKISFSHIGYVLV